MVTLHNIWRTTKPGILIPTGIIMPFNDVVANIPTGWTQYDGNDKSVRGDTTTAGTEAGNTTQAMSTTTNGSHTGTKNNVGRGGYTGSGISMPIVGGAAGSHNHSLTATYAPARRYQVMMKATTDHKKFPVNTGILSDFSLDAIATDITPAGQEMLYAAKVGGSNNNTNAAQLFSTSGWNYKANHHHQGTASRSNTDGGSGSPPYQTGGGHSTHGTTPTITDSQYMFWMGMWASAANELKAISGIYGMWESATPPKGWVICDGNNGTPDLSAYHIGLDSGAAMGTKTGNGTVSLGGSAAYGASHDHYENIAAQPGMVVHYHGDAQGHSHSLNTTVPAWSQEYKTLIFIKAL